MKSRWRKVETVVEIDNETQAGNVPLLPGNQDPGPWYGRPTGILVLSVVSGLILLVIRAAINYYFPGLLVM